MENEILNEEEMNVLTLTDENGVDTEFEYLDVIEYQGNEYLFLMPLDEDEQEGIVILQIEPVDEENENYLAVEDEANEIVILEVEPVDEENENYLAVTDDAVLDAVYAIFKEKFQDVLEFED